MGRVPIRIILSRCTSLFRGKCIFFSFICIFFGVFCHFSMFFACCLKKNVYICNIFVYKSECTRYEVRGSLFIYSQKNQNNMQKRLQLLLALLAFMVTSAMAQITTSGISGKISSNGETVIGATVTATHQPSGTVYRAVTNVDGRYTIQGMRPGGPYKVSISYIGYKDKVFNNVSLNLGESQNLSCSLQEDAKQLQEVVVSGKAGLNGTKTGAAMSINAQQIADMPSISHSIADVARLNPQLTTNGQSGSMSFAGMNNRYNSFQIDGVMNNDVFGLTANGSNGGQAGSQPVSMETIDQIQVNIAPFDVRQGGFTGGAINAVTKSGTNDFHGSGYFYGNNQDLVGRHYKNMDGTYAQPYDEEKETLFGFTLGGPIIKNKLFFFANYENSEKSYPTQYTIDSPDVKFDPDLAKDLMSKIYDLANRQGYDYATSWADKDKNVKSQKAGLKLDWNINEFNKFSVRWSYVDAKQTLGLGGIATLNTTDHLYDFKSKTHSFAAELQSRISPNLSNEARVSYVRVRDERTSGQPAPSITIYKVGNGTMNIGNEYSSMANGLNQDIYTLEDNFTWFKGNHTLTFGTHNELYKFSNLFIQNLYGCYYFDTPADFLSYYNSCGTDGLGGNGKFIKNFYFKQANVEVTGNPRWAPEFSAAQLGFYVQDKWDVTDSFQLTYGLRMDMPLFFDTPVENAKFNEWAAGKGYDLKNNRKLASTPMWSPRVGFRWDIEKNRKYILRGGIGVFTGRIPFVWLSNNFTNTGVQLSSYSASYNPAVQLVMDPFKQTQNAENLKATGSQEINVFDKNFKFTQTMRVNLGFDFNLLGIDWTAEGIFSKSLNDVYYKNLAYEETGKTLSQTSYMNWDNRPLYTKVADAKSFNNIYAMYNTSKGYSYSLSLSAAKHFAFGLDLNASYTFTHSESVSSMTSSVAQSNWRNTHTYRFSNNPELANSAYNVPHTVKASAFYHFNWGTNKLFTTTVGLIYQGQSGSPYSLVYSGDINGDNGTSNDLIFIPTDAQVDQMKFLGTDAYTAEQQRANLKQWLATTDYVKDHRGEYFERYGANLPFESHFDFHFGQKFGIRTGKYVHALELTLDIMNVANLLNKDWGRTFSSGYNSEIISPITYKGDGVFQFANSSDMPLKYPSSYYSRWRGQVGLKYTF